MDHRIEKSTHSWWAKVMNNDLRGHPVSMQEKRLLREKREAENRSTTRWRSWRCRHHSYVRPVLERGQQILSACKLWEGVIAEISGRFGSGICSYFIFLRFLILLNLMCLVLTGGFLIIPILLSEEEVSPDLSELQCGRPPPPRNLSQVTFLDFFTGEGFLENSYLFYGFYTEQKMQLSWINIPLAYLLIPFVYLLLCTLSLVKHTVHGLTLRRVWRRDYRTRISSKVFAGWDSCVRGAGTALLKQQSLSNEFKSHLAEDRWFLDIACLSFHRRLYILVTRVLLNCVILAMMAGGFYSIHLATGVSQDYQVRAVDPVLSLVIQYLVPIVISLVLTILPHIFMLIGKYEGHSPNDEITLALIRCVFLRLGTLAIFLFSLAQKILCLGSSRPSCEACGYNENFQCWETTVGQEFYKLSMFHFLRVLAEFLLLQIPRRFLVSRSQCCLVRWLGQEKFQLSQNVLDMVYEQTLVWGGLFYAPLLPLFNIIFIFIIFYIKKFSLYRLCDVSQRLFRDSASRILFHFVLLLGLMTVFLPLIYMVTRVRPSRSCGPFTEYSTAWEVLQNSTRSALPPSVMKTLDIITSHLFGYALIMFLSLLLTSCISRVRQYEDIIEHWKEYLSYQIQDKIFLIKRLRKQQSLTGEIPTEESCNWQDHNTLSSCDPNSLSIEALYDLHSPANNTLCDQNSPSIEALCERNSPSTRVLQDLQSLPTEQSCKWQSPTVPSCELNAIANEEIFELHDTIVPVSCGLNDLAIEGSYILNCHPTEVSCDLYGLTSELSLV